MYKKPPGNTAITIGTALAQKNEQKKRNHPLMVPFLFDTNIRWRYVMRDTPYDEGRLGWVAVFLLTGWLQLLIVIICGLANQTLDSNHWNTLFLNSLVVWIATSVISHLSWFISWGRDDYHRLVLRCRLLDPRITPDKLDSLVFNLGSIPGFFLGTILTD